MDRRTDAQRWTGDNLPRVTALTVSRTHCCNASMSAEQRSRRHGDTETGRLGCLQTSACQARAPGGGGH
jgi:hypothetical protein